EADLEDLRRRELRAATEEERAQATADRQTKMLLLARLRRELRELQPEPPPPPPVNEEEAQAEIERLKTELARTKAELEATRAELARVRDGTKWKAELEERLKAQRRARELLERGSELPRSIPAEMK